MSKKPFESRPLFAYSGSPVLIEAQEAGFPLQEALPAILNSYQSLLYVKGALLFRGFTVGDALSFRAFARGFGDALLPYDFASTPRSHVTDDVFTSTEYPASQRIPLHNEQAYTREWAMRLWFYCTLPSETGGETPLADSREINRRISEPIRTRFINKGLMYVRNYGNGLDLHWTKVFNTSRKQDVEAYCAEKGISCEWKADGELRTRQVCRAIERHPHTGEEVWFNQAHLFHISALPLPIRQALLEVVDKEDLPRNVYYGDGSEIETGVLEEIRGVIDDLTITFTWQVNDVLMIDNMLIAHGRNAFTGNRKVLVCMARSHSNLPTSLF